ncbi:GIY-YIG nuclease family protein [Thalassolituus alkanivorans]|uniref:GIY-YIG nuclease family protein n=1 Tax=Thalassolituus alkanivorans TaxID=2881055 RepID=UPI001E34DAE2|nr:GIY-YIG nuclease family protein [Thalassolituus alkanivorans]MCB2386913.1 GIY-YIG nuclease family protein [Thalassolituus alkanivorans]MCB2422265.1 GIY-YIG nuclease family protein [Thalassolituus alkanivorans]
MPAESSPCWSLYLVRMASGQLYCGISTDVERRFAEHCANGAKTARALRGRGPLALVYQTAVGAHGDALRAEIRVKKLPKVEKEKLIRGERPLP